MTTNAIYVFKNPIDNVEEFSYLGSSVTRDGNVDREIQLRVNNATLKSSSVTRNGV